MTEIEDVEAALARYRPVGPSLALRARVIAATELASAPGHPWWRWALVGSTAAAITAAAWWATLVPVAPQEQSAGVPADRVGGLGPRAQATATLSLQDRTAFQASWSQLPRVDLGVSMAGPGVSVVLFTDWLCPPCGAVYQYARDLVARYERVTPGQVRLVVKDWPFDLSCNPRVLGTIPGREGSCFAAAAVRAAERRGRSEDMIQWLIEPRRFSGLSGSAVKGAIAMKAREVLGSDAGIEIAAAEGAVTGELTRPLRFEPRATPTLFVNGRQLEFGAAGSMAYLDLAVELELQDAGAAPRGRRMGPRPRGRVGQ